MKVTLNHILDTCNALALSSSLAGGGGGSIMLSSIDVTLFPCVLLGLFTALAGPASLGRVDFSLLTKLILRVPSMSMSMPHVAVAGHVQQHLGLPVPIPSVRHLELDGVSVIWNSVSNLKYLSLRELVDERCPSVGELRGMLARSSGTLEWCKLENVLPMDEADSLDAAMYEADDEPIRLSSLKSFTISAKPLTVASILRSLSFSPTTQLRLFTSLHPSLHPSLGGDLQDILPPNYRLGPEVSALRLGRNSASFFRQARPSSSSSTPHSSDQVLLISSASPVPLPLTILNSLSSSTGFYYPYYPSGSIYSTTFLTSLDIAVGVLLHLSEQNLRLFLAGAKNLEQIWVGYQCDLWVLLRALVPTGQVEEASSDAVDVPCPNLRLLSFNKPADRDRWWKFGEMWTEAVVELVILRARFGVKLERLEFWRCHGIEELAVRARMSEKIMMDSLDSVVGEVVAGEGY
ncbi:hypothetical protein EST38_g8545 [Candolleomyces aberdarensis]|uniref:F-box protein n=1 Tax=Candolleomyces aberdarensis TaxID=2316362 RepID=A0A4Q2DED7_9AGAR|nr:hypothetical protein EST38_g8545 [Candolleomyces aberdarensis]